MFSEENNLESPSNKTEQHYTHHTYDNTSGITKPPYYLINIPPMFEHEF